MSVTEVRVARGGGPVSVRVSESRGPHAIVCLVWRFDDVARRDALVGEISREVADLPLGAPDAVDGKGFLVDGFVAPAPCGQPGPYQVVVTVLQGGRELHRAVPPDHGTGTIGSGEVHFRYPFVLRLERRGGRRSLRPPTSADKRSPRLPADSGTASRRHVGVPAAGRVSGQTETQRLTRPHGHARSPPSR